MDWLLERVAFVELIDEEAERVLLRRVDDNVDNEEEALHCAATVTVTVTGFPQTEVSTALVLAALVMAADVEESWPFFPPRFSTSGSETRGAAAANARREEQIMTERIVMRKCKYLRN